MSSVAVMPQQQGRRIDIIVDGDSNKLGDLVEKMENVKLNNNSDSVASANSDSTDGVELDHKVVKHPLQNAWTLWFYKNDKSRDWTECQRSIITVSTVEDFWSLYNHIEVASKLPSGSDYSLFKEGIFPDWEDVRNANGGRWIIEMDRRQRAECLDTYWLEILFFLIGEHADQHAHQVNGAVVNVRNKTDKLAIWLADASKEDSLVRIGKMVKERLGIAPEKEIGFTVHKDEKYKSSSHKKRALKV